ncbi:hypothetical protein LINPERHAP1_LOCUS9530 [Linum perenne]
MQRWFRKLSVITKDLDPLGGIIVQEILRLMGSSPSFKLLTVRRSANRVAHSVARLALRYLPGVLLPVVLTPWVDCS